MIAPNNPTQNGPSPIIEISGEQNKDITDILLMPSQQGSMLFGLINENKQNNENQPGQNNLTPIQSDFTMVNVTNGKMVELDLRHGSRTPPNTAIYLNTADVSGMFGSKKSRIEVEHFSGHPQLIVGEKSHVAIKDVSEFMGFKPGPAIEGKPTMTSSAMTFKRDADGTIAVLRDGKPVLSVPKDTKVEILGKNGKVLFTVDGNEDPETLAKKYKDAEKAAFAEYQANATDASVKKATFHPGQTAQAEQMQAQAAPQEGKAPEQAAAAKEGGNLMGGFGSLQTAGENMTKLGLSGVGHQLKEQVVNTGKTMLDQATGLPIKPTGPGTGSGIV